MKKNLKKNLKLKKTIGRKDKADFPEFDLENLDIKMDTGAYTSAIHCHKIEKQQKDGKDIVVFALLDPSHPQYNKQIYSTRNFQEKKVKSSFGSSEKRFIIQTEIILFGQKYPIHLSLSKRGEMKFPILIGRRFLIGKFIVDPSKYDVSYKKKQKALESDN